MNDRLQALIDKLDVMRDDVLNLYLLELDNYTAAKGSMGAVERAGILHDLDKHITNLHGEIKRQEAILFQAAMKAAEVTNA